MGKVVWIFLGNRWFCIFVPYLNISVLISLTYPTIKRQTKNHYLFFWKITCKNIIILYKSLCEQILKFQVDFIYGLIHLFRNTLLVVLLNWFRIRKHLSKITLLKIEHKLWLCYFEHILTKHMAWPIYRETSRNVEDGWKNLQYSIHIILELLFL